MALVFNDIDIADINKAKAEGGKIWYNKDLERLKRKIKDNFIFNDTSKCCYCSRLFVGEFRMVIDIEHVLPQQAFQSEMFNLLNLNVSCKRCNMEIKNDNIDFIQNIEAMGTDYYNPIHYKIIHPNLDNYENHLLLKTIRSGDLIFIKYIKQNELKGKYTYDYFELEDLEIDTINQAQGIKPGNSLNSNIKGFIRINFLKLLTKL